MKIEISFDIVKDFYGSTDHHSYDQWNRFKSEFIKNAWKFKTADEYLDSLRMRTDLSEDDFSEMESLDAGLTALLKMIHL